MILSFYPSHVQRDNVTNKCRYRNDFQHTQGTKTAQLGMNKNEITVQCDGYCRYYYCIEHTTRTRMSRSDKKTMS